MNKLIVSVLAKIYFVIFLLTTSISGHANEELSIWQKPILVYQQDFDWLKLTSDE
ncbi:MULTISPECIES: hypothetical protein [Colwellia]|uniref:Uncharacterized protein n=1 Tax=Colwellia marinimaniae TaxID=1513592 RepID=A0ABQ0MYX5_9GAMM|nr:MULTISPECIES: hypothetical protein [Colwellia]GAW97560.1 hypothetical protein MTCD1_03188 [Colwellia marinimaniae]